MKMCTFYEAGTPGNLPKIILPEGKIISVLQAELAPAKFVVGDSIQCRDMRSLDLRVTDTPLLQEFVPIQKQLIEALSDTDNQNGERLLNAVKVALRNYPIEHLKSRRKRRKLQPTNPKSKSNSTHRLKVTLRSRSDGESGDDRISIYVPKKFQQNPKTGRMRKYMYLNVKKVEKLSSKGREIIPKFVEFCEVFVHNATDDLNDEEFREWIHSGWPMGRQHPIFTNICELFKMDQSESAPARIRVISETMISL